MTTHASHNHTELGEQVGSLGRATDDSGAVSSTASSIKHTLVANDASPPTRDISRYPDPTDTNCDSPFLPPSPWLTGSCARRNIVSLVRLCFFCSFDYPCVAP